MCSELECGICYRTYNAGRRCPRELQCKHTFCESCLLTLSRPPVPDEARQGADRSVVCPFCRHTTSVPAGAKVRAAVRVDECVLEQLVAAGVLDREEEDEPEEQRQEEEEEEEKEEEEGEGARDDSEGATLPETQAEESDSLAGSGGGSLRCSWRKVWRKISGKSSRQRNRENCLTGDDMRNLAMMSCYMF